MPSWYNSNLLVIIQTPGPATRQYNAMMMSHWHHICFDPFMVVSVICLYLGTWHLTIHGSFLQATSSEYTSWVLRPHEASRRCPTVFGQSLPNYGFCNTLLEIIRHRDPVVIQPLPSAWLVLWYIYRHGSLCASRIQIGRINFISWQATVSHTHCSRDKGIAPSNLREAGRRMIFMQLSFS